MHPSSRNSAALFGSTVAEASAAEPLTGRSYACYLGPALSERSADLPGSKSAASTGGAHQPVRRQRFCANINRVWEAAAIPRPKGRPAPLKTRRPDNAEWDCRLASMHAAATRQQKPLRGG